MQTRIFMISKKSITKVAASVVKAMPAIPYIMKSRQRTSVTAYVVAGLGFAVAGGLVALMFFSPRTRSRALNVAKEGYGKVSDKINHLSGHNGINHITEPQPMANGLVEHDYTTA